MFLPILFTWLQQWRGTYWKTIWKDASYTGHRESNSWKLTTRRGVRKSSLQKQNTNYVYLLPCTQISKAFYVNKTRMSHRHQSSSSPCDSCIYPKYSDGQYFEPPQVNIGDDTAEKFLDQVLAAATICRQHLTKKSLWNSWPKNNGRNTTMPSPLRVVE